MSDTKNESRENSKGEKLPSTILFEEDSSSGFENVKSKNCMMEQKE